MSKEALDAEKNVDIHDRVNDAYYGLLGDKFMRETQERIHWIARQVEGISVLDVGCSQGIIPLLLAREGCSVVGVDISPQAIEEAKEYLSPEPTHVQKKVTYVNADFLAVDSQELSIDTIIISEVLEHLARPETFVKKAAEILKPEQKIIVTVPFGINDYIDHKHTFYFLEPYQFISKFFNITQVEILGKWIGIVGEKLKPNQVPSNWLNNEIFISKLEKGFFDVERAAVDDLKDKSERLSKANSRYREATTRITEQNTEIKELIKTKEKLQSTKEELQSTKEELQSTKEELQSTKEELQSTKEELQSTKEELQLDMANLQNQVAIANEKRDGHYKKLLHERELSKVLSREKRQIEVELRRAKKHAAEFKASITYQLGSLMKSATTIRGFVGFPLASIRLFRKYRFRKKHKKFPSNGGPAATPMDSQGKKLVNKIPIMTSPLDQGTSLSSEEKAKSQLKIKDQIIIDGWPTYSPSSEKPAAISIMDEFTTDCFSSDLTLIQPRPDNWRPLAMKYEPSMIFIESAWKGNFGSWQYRVGQYANKPGEEVAELAEYGRSNNIPVIFWNKEDPVHHDKFMESAKQADVIFTTDANMIPSYQKRTGNEKVYSLPFAAQPSLHSPSSLEGRIKKSCFAGSWYGGRHVERGSAMEWLLKAAKPYGLDIFDRNYGTEAFPFPSEYKDNILGSLPYEELCKIYGKYRVFLNVNSVTNSPTMFSRRVFELLACGTPVISTYARGIEEMFGDDIVWMVNNEKEAQQALEILLNDDQEWRRRSLVGIRKVFSQHTYKHRLQYVYETIGVNYLHNLEPSIALIASIENQGQVNQIAENFKAQVYKNYNLFMVTDKNVTQPVNIGSKAKILSSNQVKVENLPSILQPFDLFGLIDPAADYAPGYLQDLINATTYAPSAHCWGVATTADKFSLDCPVHAIGCIHRIHNCSFSDVMQLPTTTIQRKHVFSLDSDQFAPSKGTQR